MYSLIVQDDSHPGTNGRVFIAMPEGGVANLLAVANGESGAGTQGPKGDKGDAGDTGPTGPTGPTVHMWKRTA
jgi:hypothetical protein